MAVVIGVMGGSVDGMGRVKSKSRGWVLAPCVQAVDPFCFVGMGEMGVVGFGFVVVVAVCMYVCVCVCVCVCACVCVSNG